MVGHLVLRPCSRPRLLLERETAADLVLLQAAVAAGPDLGERKLQRRLDRAAKALVKAGVRRVLVPPEFCHWPQLERWGLRRVDPVPMLQALAAPLALAALERRNCPPERSAVALCAARVTYQVCRAALELCPRVRHLVVRVPVGGERLAAQLRAQFGLPRLEAESGIHAQVAVCFSPDIGVETDHRLELFGRSPSLGGAELRVEEQPELGESEKLPFLSLLWETGRLSPADIRVL